MARVAATFAWLTGRRLAGIAVELWLPILLFAGWWVASSGSASLYFVGLDSILGALRDDWLGEAGAANVLPSLRNLAEGFLLAAFIGVVLGTVLGLVRPLGNAVSPIVEFLRSVPGVALLPIGLLIFGIGSEMKVSLIAYGSVWPILLNTIDGVRSVDAIKLDVLRSYRVPAHLRILGVVLPSAAPRIMVGLRTSLSIAITIIVFSEMIGSTDGIGYAILQAQRNFEIPQMWAGMLALGVIGYLLNIGFRGVEQLVLRRHRAMNTTPGS
ncbi:MAG TPA: ABC transporter permease [Pseudonocardia sp.]|uniref:ABC transporter permease n=1 Tax=Pseudonocardia sp. TaxID=60912 RepID=UPI002C475A1C|nr:ABC transporter permease [Pseudonocardia sp.]HTF49740.1 ABC transporter permease [Pseudonocardia sp.]